VDTVFAKGYFTSAVQMQAICKWLRYYQRTRSAGDPVGLARAASVISSISTWYTYRVSAVPGGGYREQLDTIIQEVQDKGSTPTLDQYASTCGP
jgi:hypothetical protein